MAFPNLFLEFIVIFIFMTVCGIFKFSTFFSIVSHQIKSQYKFPENKKKIKIINSITKIKRSTLYYHYLIS